MQFFGSKLSNALARCVLIVCMCSMTIRLDGLLFRVVPLVAPVVSAGQEVSFSLLVDLATWPSVMSHRSMAKGKAVV